MLLCLRCYVNSHSNCCIGGVVRTFLCQVSFIIIIQICKEGKNLTQLYKILVYFGLGAHLQIQKNVFQNNFGRLKF